MGFVNIYFLKSYSHAEKPALTAILLARLCLSWIFWGKYNWENREGGDKIIYVIREAQREECKMAGEVYY